MPEPITPVDPATPTQAVEPPATETPTTPETVTPPVEQAPAKSARETELERQLEEERSKTAEARNSDRKRREALKKEREDAGNYQALYNEQAEEAKAATARAEAAEAELSRIKTEHEATAKELTSYRDSLVESFQPDDREMVKDLPLAQLASVYKRLYGGDLVKPSQSLGSGKPGGVIAADFNLEAAVQSKDTGKINAAFDAELKAANEAKRSYR